MGTYLSKHPGMYPSGPEGRQSSCPRTREPRYHIFYELLAGHPDLGAFSLDRNKEYRLLKTNRMQQQNDARGRNDAENYKTLVGGLEHLEFEAIDELLALVAMLIHWGECHFTGDQGDVRICLTICFGRWAS